MSTPYWRCIHYFALHNQRDLILQVKDFFEDLSGAWYAPESTDDLVEWSRELHNKMNTLSGKYDQWDSQDFAIAQKPTCDVCMGTLVHRFPWGLLHSVAEQANSMEFLKNFNAQYPCETCRGGFFDEPQTGETTLDWTYRNHQRLDPSFVIPVPPPLDPLVPYGYSKDPFTNEIIPIVAKLPGYSA